MCLGQAAFSYLPRYEASARKWIFLKDFKTFLKPNFVSGKWNRSKIILKN